MPDVPEPQFDPEEINGAALPQQTSSVVAENEEVAPPSPQVDTQIPPVAASPPIATGMGTGESTKEKINAERMRTFLNAPRGTVVNCPVEFLRPHEHNPNKIVDEAKQEALKTSIEKDPEFLKLRPVIVNGLPGREGVILGGEKRFFAVQLLGWEKVPVIVVDADPNRERAILLKDNNHAGEEDQVTQRQILEDLRSAGFDMTSLSYAASDLTSLMTIDSDPLTSAADDPDNQGAAGNGGGKNYLQCPDCSFTGHKKDFVRMSKEEADSANHDRLSTSGPIDAEIPPNADFI